jgi:hypothetical protein
MNGSAAGTLALSIDLELDLEHQETDDHRRLDDVRRQLIALLGASAAAATWAVADPLLSAATEPVLAAGAGHEVAVLGDRAWVSPGCGRARLIRELDRRFSAARKAGIPVSTLVLRNVEHIIDLDLLLDHGVTALAMPAVEQPASTRRVVERPSRFGLWQPPTAWKLPPHSSWWRPASWRLRGAINQAIRSRSLLHLRLDGPRLVAAGEPALATLGQMLTFAAAKRDAGQLAIRTLGDLAAEALQTRSAEPTRSILRPAA